MPDPALRVALRIRADLQDAVRKIGRLEREVTRTGRAVRSTGRHADAGAAGIDRMGRSARTAAVDINRMDTAIGAFAGSLAAGLVQRALSEIARLPGVFRDAGLEIEALQQRFSFAAGGIAAGAENLRFIREQAERLGISFAAASRGYSSLLAASRGTNVSIEETRQLFLGIAEASAVLRLSQDEVEGALRAVQQVMSKGTLQAEEIRGQLGERLPGAFQIAARAMGVTTEELNRLLERGEVLSDEFLPRFGQQLRDEFASGVEDAADSAAASFNRMGNALERMFQTVAENRGVLDFFESLSGAVTRAATTIELAASGDPVRQIAGVLDERERTEPGLSQGPGDVQGRNLQASRQIAALLDDLNAAGADLPVEIQRRLQESGLLKEVFLDALNEAIARSRDRAASLALEDVRPEPVQLPAVTVSAPEVDERRLAAAQRFLERVEDQRLRATEQRIERSRRAEERQIAELDALRAEGLLSARDYQSGLADIQQAGAAERTRIEIDAEARRAAEARRIRESEQREAQRHAREEQAAERERLLALGNLDRLETGLSDPYEGAVSSVEAWRDATVQAFRDAGLRASEYGDIVGAVFNERLAAVGEEFAERQLRESRRWTDGARRAFEDYADAATNAASSIETAIGNSLRSMEDVLVGFVQTGKLEFGSLVDSIVADLARLVIQQQITGPLAQGLGGLFGGLFGGGGAYGGTNPYINLFHAGGRVGSGSGRLRQAPPQAFAIAPRYHSGGIAGLRPDEVPAILQRGETVIPRDGGPAMPPVVINFENRGVPQQETQRQVRLDPRGLIVDVVIDDLDRGGPIRDRIRRQGAGGV